MNIASIPFVLLSPGETPLTCVLLRCLSLMSLFFSLVISISLLFSAFGDSLKRVLHITDVIIHKVYCTMPNTLRKSVNSFFISKPLFLFLSGFFFDFCLPVSKLTFDIYCLISFLISCFIETRLN